MKNKYRLSIEELDNILGVSIISSKPLSSLDGVTTMIFEYEGFIALETLEKGKYCTHAFFDSEELAAAHEAVLNEKALKLGEDRWLFKDNILIYKNGAKRFYLEGLLCEDLTLFV